MFVPSPGTRIWPTSGIFEGACNDFSLLKQFAISTYIDDLITKTGKCTRVLVGWGLLPAVARATVEPQTQGWQKASFIFLSFCLL